MNLNDMISQIQMRLGFRKDLIDEIIREIQLAQYQLEHDVTFNPHFLWRGKDICICPDCIDYALPAGFLRLCEFNQPLFHCKDSSSAYELNRGIGNIAYAKDNPAGSPVYYTIQSNNLRLNVRACGILRLFYITATTQLSSSVLENLWTQKAYDVLLNKAGYAMALTVQNEAASARFGNDYARSLINFKRECIAYEDFGYDLARAESLYAGPIQETGGWYEPGSVDCEACEPEAIP